MSAPTSPDPAPTDAPAPAPAVLHPEILAPLPRAARFLSFRRSAAATTTQVGTALARINVTEGILIGIGPRLVRELGGELPGLAPFPDLAAEGATVPLPATPLDLFVRVSGDDPGTVLHRSRALLAALPPGLTLVDTTDGFLHRENRDLTGYEDGTENPSGAAAVAAALAQGHGPGIDGGSVLAVQRWVHDFGAFGALSKQEQDHAIGRERDSNAELDDAPESAHVKRTAQEDFDPEAFVWRRSMPWSDHRGAGLMFLAFGASLAPFAAQLRRMSGVEDGVVDALFGFSRPETGAVFWCPPVRDGALDLRALDRI